MAQARVTAAYSLLIRPAFASFFTQLSRQNRKTLKKTPTYPNRREWK